MRFKTRPLPSLSGLRADESATPTHRGLIVGGLLAAGVALLWLARDPFGAGKRLGGLRMLPTKKGQSTTVSAHGKRLVVKKHSASSWFLKVAGESRARWGNKAEAQEDVAFFKEYGALPRSSGFSPY